MARQKDKERDEAVRTNQTDRLGLMHGVPVSIKDHVILFIELVQISEKGRISNVGVMHYADYKATEDALVVKQIKDQGAIPMVKGNVPQLVFALHSEN